MPQLESTTATWTNVNVQTYTMGTTVFKDNLFTGCSNIALCDANSYTLDSRTAKARLITHQEAVSSGCASISTESCPDFMHNYLYQSKPYGGSISDDTQTDAGDYNYGYWTMSVHSM